jgi:hypothetical protein
MKLVEKLDKRYARLFIAVLCSFVLCDVHQEVRAATTSSLYARGVGDVMQENTAPGKPADGASNSVMQPLPDRASGEQVWRRVVRLLDFPNGLITADDVQEIFASPIYYSSKDSSGYEASFSDVKTKNYSVGIIYLYHALALNNKYSSGAESTVSVNFPLSDCLPLDRVGADLISRGMHYSGELLPPVSQAKLYGYPDGVGSVHVGYVRRDDGKESRACVNLIMISGHATPK